MKCCHTKSHQLLSLTKQKEKKVVHNNIILGIIVKDLNYKPSFRILLHLSQNL